MKVLLVNPTFGGVSGSGRHVKLLHDFLRERVNFEIWSGENIGLIDIPKLRSLSFYLRCSLREVPDDVDIIHVHNPKLAGLFDGRRRGVLTIHGSYEEELMAQYGGLARLAIRYIKRNLRKADEITCVDPYTAERTGWKWIPNMVDTEQIERIHPLSKDRRLLWIGRDDPVKNHLLFREVAKIVYDKHGVKSLALGIPEGRYPSANWISYRKVEWKEVIGHLKSAYALLITSKIEGLPSTVLEAWASRCPVISAPLPSLIRVNEIYGEVIKISDSHSPKELYELVAEILEERPDDMIERAHKIAKERFDARIVSSQYYKVYEVLLQS